jgi:hypothetical protein
MSWVRILQIVGVVLVLWAAVTLISGLVFAEVDPDDPEFGRAYPFEDTGIPGYGTIAWVGGAIGVALVVVTYFLGKTSKS